MCQKPRSLEQRQQMGQEPWAHCRMREHGGDAQSMREMMTPLGGVTAGYAALPGAIPQTLRRGVREQVRAKEPR